eukprot:6270032-Pyramimonas_sp.AAC.1
MPPAVLVAAVTTAAASATSKDIIAAVAAATRAAATILDVPKNDIGRRCRRTFDAIRVDVGPAASVGVDDIRLVDVAQGQRVRSFLPPRTCWPPATASAPSATATAPGLKSLVGVELAAPELNLAIGGLRTRELVDDEISWGQAANHAAALAESEEADRPANVLA